MAQVAVDPAPKAPPRMSEVLNPKLTLLMVVSGFRSVSSYMLTPFLAIYFHLVLGFSLPISGFLAGLPFLAAWAFGVLGGYAADRLGLTRAYAVAGVVAAVALFALAFAHALLLVALIMVVFGAMRPVGTNTVSALANQHVAREYRGQMENYLYWVSNAGVMAGLLLAADVLAGGHSNTVIFVVAALTLVLVVPVIVMFGTEKPNAPAPEEEAKPGFGAALGLLVRDRALVLAAGTLLAMILMESQLNATVPIALTLHFKNGAALLGPLLAIDTVMVLVGQPLVSKYFAKFPPVNMFFAGAVMGAGGLALGGIGGTVLLWIIGMIVYGIGEVFWAVQVNQLLGELPVPGREALYFSVIGMAQYLAMFVGTTVGVSLVKGFAAALWIGVIVVALLGVWMFRAGAEALRRRGAATADVEVRAPGFAEAAPEAATPLAEAPVFQGGGAVLPIARVSQVAIFDVPVTSTPIVFLEALSPDEWDQVWSYGTSEQVSAGTVLVEAGATDRSVYLVEDGELEVLVADPAGGQRRLTLMTPGSVFGEQAFLDGLPRSASIRAVTPCHIRKLGWDDFQTMAADRPGLAQTVLLDLARVVSERLRRTTEALNLLRSA